MQIASSVPNLGPNEHAFTLDTGETAVVTVEPQAFAAGHEQVTVFLTPRLVDPTTGETVRAGTHDVVCPSHSFSVLTAALADGKHDLPLLLANEMQEQALRARRVLAALTSLNAITRIP